VIDLIQPAGAGGTMTAITEVPTPSTIGGSMYGVSIQVGTLSGDYELKLTLEDGKTTLAVLIVCPDNSAAPSTAPSESPKRLL